MNQRHGAMPRDSEVDSPVLAGEDVHSPRHRWTQRDPSRLFTGDNKLTVKFIWKCKLS